MTFDDQWVDEVARGLKACGVFCWFPIYCKFRGYHSPRDRLVLTHAFQWWLGLTYNQLNNNLTSQAATMTTNGLPNDVLSNLDPFALIIFIPICDLIIYPALRRGGINFSALKKITAGFATGAMSMIWATVLQHYIYKTNPCGTAASTCVDSAKNVLVSPLNVWIQTGA